MDENKFLKAARAAREDKNSADAKRYYEMVKMEDPENAEARFFYAYYTIADGKKGEAYNSYMRFLAVVAPSIKTLASSDMEAVEKETLIKDMAMTARKVPMLMHNALCDISTTPTGRKHLETANKESIGLLYSFGDEVEKAFADNETIIKLVSVEMWKDAIELQGKWTAVPFDKSYPEKYTAKIKKYDPNYVPPKASGFRKVLGAILGFASKYASR